MNFNEIITSLSRELPLRNAVKLNKEDGEVIEKYGETNSLLNDTGAFLGSAGEIIREKTAIDSLNYITVKTDPVIVIIDSQTSFIAIELSEYKNPSEIYAEYKSLAEPQTEEPEEEPEAEATAEETPEGDMDDLMQAADSIEETEQKEDALSEEERHMLSNKVTQINFLMKEFSKETDKEQWVSDIKSSIDKLDKICNCIEFDENNDLIIKDTVMESMNKKEIQTSSKTIIDSLCKSAVREFGAKEAKSKVQNVISKLNKSRG